jgi:hypothetical protein
MGIVRDGRGNPVVNSKGKPIKSGSSVDATDKVPQYESFAEFQEASPMAASFAQGIAGKFGIDLNDPAAGRMMSAGITKGANPGTNAAIIGNSNPAVGVTTDDHRVRLSLPPRSKILYNSDQSHLIAPLKETNGVVFPYTPQVIFQHNADYSRTSPTHSNYPLNFYHNSSVQDITIFGEFTATDGPSAQYVLAVITFLRAITKMFSNSDSLAGNPPPILRLSGHGQYILPSIPVVATTVSITMPSDVDYITIPTPPAARGTNYSAPGATITTRIPRSCEISIGVVPVYSRRQMRSFGVDKLANGQLISKIRGGHI